MSVVKRWLEDGEHAQPHARSRTIKIEFHYFGGQCEAETWIDGKVYVGLGETWELAEQRLLDNVRSQVAAVPPNKEVEI